MQTHRIIAADWQVKTPSAGRLKAIVLPLEEMGQTQQYSCVGNEFVVESTYGCYSENGWCFNTTRPTFEQALEVVNNWGNTMRICTPEGIVLYDPNYYQKGDHIFLTEKWCNYSGNILSQSTHPCPEYEDTWQPAETMPEDAAVHWFEVTGVRIVPMQSLTIKTAIDAGLTSLRNHCVNGDAMELSAIQGRWNTAHPDYPWNSNRHVNVLDIEKHATTNPK